MGLKKGEKRPAHWKKPGPKVVPPQPLPDSAFARCDDIIRRSKAGLNAPAIATHLLDWHRRRLQPGFQSPCGTLAVSQDMHLLVNGRAISRHNTLIFDWLLNPQELACAKALNSCFRYDKGHGMYRVLDMTPNTPIETIFKRTQDMLDELAFLCRKKMWQDLPGFLQGKRRYAVQQFRQDLHLDWDDYYTLLPEVQEVGDFKKYTTRL